MLILSTIASEVKAKMEEQTETATTMIKAVATITKIHAATRTHHFASARTAGNVTLDNAISH